MTDEEQKTAVRAYIAAYNRFDIDGMTALVHPDIVFKHFSGTEVDAETSGVEEFRELALKTKAMFSSRRQQATNLRVTDESAIADIAFQGVLAVDLPNGKQAGEVLRVEGRSEFEFKDDKIVRITDFS
jgi:ketosteroid isomerase-like protein